MTLALLTPQAALPSPTTAAWELGPLTIRAYALCLLLGIVVASLVTERRLRSRGAPPWAVLDIATFAVPAGIIGARIYHVLTSWQEYFGAGGEPLKALRVWEGGLGIWGAVAGGALGAWFAARKVGIPFAMVADALAPGLPLAQAVGRFGNWFNNELYGGPTTLPWGLKVYEMVGGRAVRDAAGNPVPAEDLPTADTLVHPTFAYEALWNIGVAALVFFVDRKLKFGRGRAFALYVMGYTAGRFWIEMMRTDEANQILGVRLNVWTAVLVFVGALLYFLRVRGPREYLIPAGGAPAAEAPEGAQGRDAAADTGAAKAGYRVVDEAEYRSYQRTGEVPDDEPEGTSTRPANDVQ
ncbi:MAG TPA: prolipoprotein diacylglyceryl transferase [Micromonospora sp.]|nr:prolipoprotein diacylglyceryl transferase [Micromonospora sp.]